MAVMYGAPPPIPATPPTWEYSAPVDPPPSYAADPEVAAVAAVVALDDEARRRVLRYLGSRFGDINP